MDTSRMTQIMFETGSKRLLHCYWYVSLSWLSESVHWAGSVGLTQLVWVDSLQVGSGRNDKSELKWVELILSGRVGLLWRRSDPIWLNRVNSGDDEEVGESTTMTGTMGGRRQLRWQGRRMKLVMKTVVNEDEGKPAVEIEGIFGGEDYLWPGGRILDAEVVDVDKEKGESDKRDLVSGRWEG